MITKSPTVIVYNVKRVILRPLILGNENNIRRSSLESKHMMQFTSPRYKWWCTMCTILNFIPQWPPVPCLSNWAPEGWGDGKEREWVKYHICIIRAPLNFYVAARPSIPLIISTWCDDGRSGQSLWWCCGSVLFCPVQSPGELPARFTHSFILQSAVAPHPVHHIGGKLQCWPRDKLKQQ